MFYFLFKVSYLNLLATRQRGIDKWKIPLSTVEGQKDKEDKKGRVIINPHIKEDFLSAFYYLLCKALNLFHDKQTFFFYSFWNCVHMCSKISLLEYTSL